jgi:hypothetical protein
VVRDGPIGAVKGHAGRRLRAAGQRTDALIRPAPLSANAPRGRFKPALARFAGSGWGGKDPPRQTAPRGRLRAFCAAGPEAGSRSHPGLPVAAGGRGPARCSQAAVLQFEVELMLIMLDQCYQRRVGSGSESTSGSAQRL